VSWFFLFFFFFFVFLKPLSRSFETLLIILLFWDEYWVKSYEVTSFPVLTDLIIVGLEHSLSRTPLLYHLLTHFRLTVFGGMSPQYQNDTTKLFGSSFPGNYLSRESHIPLEPAHQTPSLFTPKLPYLLPFPIPDFLPPLIPNPHLLPTSSPSLNLTPQN
jgi:hypothetical protein